MPSWFWMFPIGRKAERTAIWGFELRQSLEGATGKLLWNKRLRQSSKGEATYHLCRLESRMVLHGHNMGNGGVWSVIRKSCHKDRLGSLSILIGIRWVVEKSTPMFCIGVSLSMKEGICLKSLDTSLGRRLALDGEENKPCTQTIPHWSGSGRRKVSLARDEQCH